MQFAWNKNKEAVDAAVASLVTGTGGGLGYFIADKEAVGDTRHDHHKYFHQNQIPTEENVRYGRINFTGKTYSHTPRPFVVIPFHPNASLDTMAIGQVSGQTLFQFAETVWKLKRPKILISKIHWRFCDDLY